MKQRKGQVTANVLIVLALAGAGVLTAATNLDPASTVGDPDNCIERDAQGECIEYRYDNTGDVMIRSGTTTRVVDYRSAGIFDGLTSWLSGGDSSNNEDDSVDVSVSDRTVVQTDSGTTTVTEDDDENNDGYVTGTEADFDNDGQTSDNDLGGSEDTTSDTTDQNDCTWWDITCGDDGESNLDKDKPDTKICEREETWVDYGEKISNGHITGYRYKAKQVEPRIEIKEDQSCSTQQETEIVKKVDCINNFEQPHVSVNGECKYYQHEVTISSLLRGIGIIS